MTLACSTSHSDATRAALHRFCHDYLRDEEPSPWQFCSDQPRSLSEVDDDAPIRLAEAARRCFPDGSMTAAGLRRLADKGLLVIERINRRDYTTLRAIKEMREQCRVVPKVRASGYAQRAATVTASNMAPSTSSSIAAAKSRLDSLLTNPTARSKH